MPAYGVLVVCSHKKRGTLMKASGALIDGTTVMTCGIMLSALLHEPELKKWLGSMLRISSKRDLVEEFNKNLTFRVYRDGGEGLVADHAVASKIWICELVRGTIDSLLDDWKFAKSDAEGDADILTRQTCTDLMSLFILLSIRNSARVDIPGVLQNLPEPSRGLNVIVESTPFGEECFFNSISRGLISNVVGHQRCLFLTDARTIFGCEGAPVFLADDYGVNGKGQLFGLIISPVSLWRGDSSGLTLGVSLSPVLRRLVSPAAVIEKPLCWNHPATMKRVVDENMVLVKSENSWGSGIVVDFLSGTIITCSHVLTKNSSSCRVFHMGSYHSAKIIYRTRDDWAYDIAVLKMSLPGVFKSQMELSNALPKVGEEVIAAGFPYFPETKDYKLRPTIVKGCISKINDHMIQTTCCIHSGSSGCAIIRDNKMLGIVVSNAKDSHSGIVYPYVNFAIPSSVLYEHIHSYLRTGNIHYLKNLECPDISVQKIWRLQSSRL